MSHDSKNSDLQDELITNEMPGHTYDGIVECDNPMPNWWIGTFLLTIIFASIYFIHYNFGGGPTLRQELAQAMTELEKVKSLQPVLMESEDTLASEMRGAGVLEKGTTAFAEKCASCHGQALQGNVGPNLTDSYWLHGKGTRVDLVKTIRLGVLEKGMPAWEAILSKTEVYGLAALILSKKGSNPGNAKPPQGELIQ